MTITGELVQLRASHYTLLAPLAASSYGEVWRAKAANGKLVALKLVNAARMQQVATEQQQTWIDCAQQEIAFLQQLAPWEQRHIPRLLDAGRHRSLPAFALELLDEDLASHLQARRARGEPVGGQRSLRWLAQINHALARVHQYGWCYLDLKPANLLLGKHGEELKLADFGSTSRARLQGFGGTPHWQAPEQFFPIRHVDSDQEWQYSLDYRSDYFALGAMLFFLVCGMPLRFCSICAQTLREQGVWGAPKLAQDRHLLTLYPDEEALFLACMRNTDGDASNANTSTSANTSTNTTSSSTQAEAALRLLKSLVARDPAQRPQSALDISAALQELIQADPAKPKQQTKQPAPRLAALENHSEPSLIGTEFLLASLICVACLVLLSLFMLPTHAALAQLVALPLLTGVV